MAKKREVKIGTLKPVFKGGLFEVRQAEVILPGGRKGKYEVVYRQPSVSVMALDAEGRLLINREYHPKIKKRVWRFPGGSIEKGESPKAAAQRELQEESGFKARQLSLFHKVVISQSINWERHVFLGKGLVQSKLPFDIGEDIEIAFLTLKEAMKLAESGEISHDLTEYLIFKLSLSKKRGL